MGLASPPPPQAGQSGYATVASALAMLAFSGWWPVSAYGAGLPTNDGDTPNPENAPLPKT